MRLHHAPFRLISQSITTTLPILGPVENIGLANQLLTSVTSIFHRVWRNPVLNFLFLIGVMICALRHDMCSPTLGLQNHPTFQSIWLCQRTLFGLECKVSLKLHWAWKVPKLWEGVKKGFNEKVYNFRGLYKIPCFVELNSGKPTQSLISNVVSNSIGFEDNIQSWIHIRTHPNIHEHLHKIIFPENNSGLENRSCLHLKQSHFWQIQVHTTGLAASQRTSLMPHYSTRTKGKIS